MSHKPKTHRVRIAVAAWPSVLQVPVTFLCHLPWNPDAAAPVGDAGGEVVDGRCLVRPGQPSLIVLACSERFVSLYSDIGEPYPHWGHKP